MFMRSLSGSRWMKPLFDIPNQRTPINNVNRRALAVRAG
jgi:hypothetical protein